MIATLTPDFIQHEPADTYHKKANEFLSSHALGDFRKSPWLFRKKKGGLIADEDRPAYVLGRAAHLLILEGRRTFNDGYAIGGPINPRTGNPFGSTTKAFQEWAAAQGRPVLTHDQVYLIEQLASGVSMNSIATEFLSSGVAEGVVRGRYMDMACQIRMDWFAADRGLVDLKTCDDLTWFESDARRYGYAHQLAFYRAVLKEVAGEQFPVHIIAIEKREPHRCGVWRIGDDVLDIAQRENEDAIERLNRCVEKDQWPTGYESIRTFDYL